MRRRFRQLCKLLCVKFLRNRMNRVARHVTLAMVEKEIAKFLKIEFRDIIGGRLKVTSL